MYYRTVSQELTETIIQMVTTYTNMYMPKAPSIRVNPVGPPTPIFRPTHQRPIGQIEGPALQVMVDQLTGLATSLASLGLNPATQNTSTFTLPGCYTLFFMLQISHFFKTFLLKFRFFGTTSSSTWITFSKSCW